MNNTDINNIDITKTQPDAPAPGFAASLKAFLFYLVQFTWGLPVNIAGGIAFLICTKIRKRRYQRFGYAFIVFLPWNAGGLSLGLFIFAKENHPKKCWTYNTRIHEYGHTWQCLLLGPLYYPIIALPSLIWCTFFDKFRKKHNISYYALYCEAWANSFGQRFSKMKMVPESMEKKA